LSRDTTPEQFDFVKEWLEDIEAQARLELLEEDEGAEEEGAEALGEVEEPILVGRPPIDLAEPRDAAINVLLELALGGGGDNQTRDQIRYAAAKALVENA